MTPSNTNFIVIGKIGSSYGIKGWLKIQSYTEFGASITDYKPLFIASPRENTWEELKLEASKPYGKSIIVKLVGVDTPEAAKLLTGRLIGIKREQLPTLQKDEYYWSDIIGMTVIDIHGKKLGVVKYLMETGANDVLVVKAEKEFAIPFLKDQVIKKIDIDRDEIIVDWEVI